MYLLSRLYHAGIPELITHNQEGFLVQENNVDELASALEYMLNERATWETYTIAARQKVEQFFDSNQQLLLQANYYDELLRRKEKERREWKEQKAGNKRRKEKEKER